MGNNDIKIQIKGQERLAEIARNTAKVNVREELDKKVVQAAFLLEGASKKRTPVDTGFLRSSIRVTKLGMASAAVGPFAEYGIYVHEGTRFMKARPFLEWGLQESTQALRELLMGTAIKIGTQITK